MGPYVEQVDPQKYIVVLDTSSSMSTRELGYERSRLERLLVELDEFSQGLNTDDEVALITSGPEAQLRVGWTTEHSQLVEATSNLEAVGDGDAGGDALRIADAMCQDREHTQIILLSDGAGIGIPPLECQLRFVSVGEIAANVGITGFTVREADGLGLNEIYLALHNASQYERELTVELEMDGALVDLFTETIGPAMTLERIRRLPLPPGDVLVARISSEGEDALLDDDIAYAVLKPGSRVQAILVTEHPTTFVAEALRLHPRVELTIAGPTDIEAISGGPYDLMFVDAPPVGPLPQADHVIFLNVGYELFELSTSGSVVQPDVIRWNFDHPIFRFVNFDDLRISTAQATELPESAVSMMDMADGPLIFLMTQDRIESLFFTFHPDLSDLPLRVAFVNLMANIVEWAQPVDDLRVTASVETGQRLSGNAPGLTLNRITEAATAAPARLDARDSVPVAGVYELQTTDGIARALVAANLFSVEEADLTPAERLGVGAISGWPEVIKSERFPVENLMLIALGLLAFEWLLPGLLGLVFRRRRGQLARKRKRSSRAKATVTAEAPMR